MTVSGEPSLRLSFHETRTKVILRAQSESHEQLVRLAARFGSGSQRGALAAEVDLEDFLSHLAFLSQWHDPAGVSFSPDLKALAEGSVKDSQAVDSRLAAGRQGLEFSETVTPVDVPGRLGTAWRAPLAEFQTRDIAKLLSLTHGANFSVPGAGKTRAAMAVYAALRHAGKVRRLLVVSPKSAYEAWQDESEHCFTAPLTVRVFERRPSTDVELLLVNYERLSRYQKDLADWLSAAPALMVLDEAHRMKLGVRGTYGTACMALGPLARHRLILTGTPAPNGVKDLESLLSFVWPGHGRRAVDKAVAGGDLAHASKILRPLFTRTTKNELDLPPADVRVHYVDLPPAHRELYSALRKRPHGATNAEQDEFSRLGKVLVYLIMASTSPKLLDKGADRYDPLPFIFPPYEPPRDGSLRDLMRDLPHYEMSPKYEAVLRTVAENARLGRKTLVWSTFVRNLTTLGIALEKFHPAVVHGGSIDRDEQIRRFRQDPDCMVMLSNPATLGEGISLHHVCHDAVYLDRDFSAGRFLQSLDRIHRLGLKTGTETRITVLIARGTIDEEIHNRLGKKLDFMGKILDDPSVQELADPDEEVAPWGMDIKDLRALLEHLDDPKI
ncbi:DEAD/DEAH box helicase [Streptomyces sp. NBC_01208]|uniref:DEAD/DEAH box helicase n=1 Tax=Streptomyces glycanivorans TaxID=3033808 RepID=A0ABY9JEL0_9ACTN|nr:MULTISPECIES: DEAD/DEAH box helicase [unclassified Streptomyces]WLQ66213.1 DEAD/DEAH box helicase [Streptomyces sp. Alt3]WSR06945.1 DEAD/DEAH box helicase [Streptomyces sp. NBC_01208]